MRSTADDCNEIHLIINFSVSWFNLRSLRVTSSCPLGSPAPEYSTISYCVEKLLKCFTYKSLVIESRVLPRRTMFSQSETPAFMMVYLDSSVVWRQEEVCCLLACWGQQHPSEAL